MTISKTIQTMRAKLPRLGASFAAARERHNALEPYAKATTLGDALADKATLASKERSAVISALVAEHQKHGGELAQSLLVIAFEPALGAIRARLHKPLDEDLDQSVLLSFLEAIRSAAIARAGDFAAPALVLETKRVLAKNLHGPRVSPKRFDDIHALLANELDDRDEFVGREETVDRDAETTADRLLREIGSDRMRDVLLATVAGDESLRDYVERCLPGVAAEQRNEEYERLRRQRQAAIARLKRLSIDLIDHAA
jgi:hypothetical protein